MKKKMPIKNNNINLNNSYFKATHAETQTTIQRVTVNLDYCFVLSKVNASNTP